MKVENVKVYDLEESVIASGYPMQVDLNNIKEEINNLKYWSNTDLIDLFLNNNTKIENIEIKNTYATIYVKNQNNDTCGYFDFDFIDLDLIINNNWHIAQNGYLKNDNGELFHRLVMNPLENQCIDHIDRNKNNNRRNNFRLCSRQENTMNCGLSKNNSSGITGVSYRKDKKKWRAYIFYKGKQINLGHFPQKNEAIVARLLAEKQYFKEFSPQIHLFEKYGIDYDYSKKEASLLNLSTALNHMKRITKLSKTGLGEGHNQALTGIRVAFDLTFTNKAWVELERYRFVEFVSSQSTMHRISKFNLNEQYNQYVDPRIVNIMGELKDKYNQTQNSEDYLKLLYSNPAGFELTARLTTNYRALKTVYFQRKSHRLPEWREFCKWIETLPHAQELIISSSNNK